MTRRTALLLACVWAATSSSALRGQGAVVTPDWREYPPSDWARQLVERGTDKRLAADLARTKPTAPETFEALLKVSDFETVLALLPRALDSDVPNAAAVLEVLRSGWRTTLPTDWDPARELRPRLLEVLAPVRQRLNTLPREVAARLAWALTPLDYQNGSVARDASRPAARTTLEDLIPDFVREYDGTEAALLASLEISCSLKTTFAQCADALTPVVQTHPATELAAHALYLIASKMSSGAGVAKGADPTDLALEWFSTVTELTSGRYPTSRWTDRGASLVPPALDFKSTPPANVDRLAAAAMEFARAHFDDGSATFAVPVSVVNWLQRLPSGSTREAATNQLGAYLESHGTDRRSLRLFKGQQGFAFSVRSAVADRSRKDAVEPDLLALADDDTGLISRRALALAANIEMALGDCGKAAPLFDRYVAKYPDTSWTWIAELRAGQCAQAAGDSRRAMAAYQHVLTRFADDPLIRVLATALSGHLLDEQGDFAGAFSKYRTALTAWDVRYGSAYEFGANRSQSPSFWDDAKWIDTVLDRRWLVERVAMLDRIAGRPQALELERGRRQFLRGDLALAHATLDGVLRVAGDAVVVAEARLLSHRLSLEEGLAAAAIESPTRDAAALKAFETAATGPFDNYAGIARLAASAILVRQGKRAEAVEAVRATLKDWADAQQPLRETTPRDSLIADLADIRRVLFRPRGDLAMLGRVSGVLSQRAPTPYMFLPAELLVTSADGLSQSCPVTQPFPSLDMPLFLRQGELRLLERVVATIGGPPNPRDASGTEAAIASVWQQFFLAGRSQISTWNFYAEPSLNVIEFVDAARTRAIARVSAGNLSTGVLLEKIDGHWVAVRITSEWIA